SDLRLFSRVYGVQGPPAFEEGYVLHLPRPLSQTAEDLSMPVSELHSRLQSIRSRLLEVRRQREPLLKDDKILTAWNGLMIRSLSRAGLILRRRDYIEAAERAALGILSRHRDA